MPSKKTMLKQSAAIMFAVCLCALLASFALVYLYSVQKVESQSEVYAESVDAASAELFASDYKTDYINTGVLKETLTIMLPMFAAFVVVFVVFLVLLNKKVITPARTQVNEQMEVARRIQCGIVPEVFELKGNSWEASALARPARQVGGDFYECFVRADGQVCAFVGDVSGKGISAALFMVLAKTMLHDALAAGDTPAAALNTVNDRLCESNPELMFATAFAAVLNPATGALVYANAGHVPPALVSGELLDVAPGIALGIFAGAGMADAHTTLKAGSGLVIYTDGVSETTNPTKEFFGEGEVRRSVTDCGTAAKCIDALTRNTAKFAAGTEQFDDYTALALYYTGTAAVKIELKPAASEVKRMREWLFAHLDDAFDKKKIFLACDEVFANMVEHSGATEVCVALAVQPSQRAEITFTDNGIDFCPLDTTADMPDFFEADAGGMGLGIISSIPDEVTYERRGDKNILTLTFFASA